MSAPTYRILEVSELTGLEPDRLRAWERRYAAVRPARQPNGYRAYSAEQVALLGAYARLIEGGERIGDLVRRPATAIGLDHQYGELRAVQLAVRSDRVRRCGVVTNFRQPNKRESLTETFRWNPALLM